jgi:alpha-methylacyl-CoA racemase
MAGLMLADFGAAVIRVDRANATYTPDKLGRGKKSIGLNLKTPEGVAVLIELVKHADVLLEPFRPGVMERLGIGPEVLLQANPKLVYARLTGYGQTGPLAQRAGHDLNYIALSGCLSLIGRAGEKPVPPYNIVGDFAGGSMLCVLGILMAIIERRVSGKGQVVDAAMIDGSSYLSTFVHLDQKDTQLMWTGATGTNLLDGGAPFYDTYRTQDGKFMAVGCLEPRFYKLFIADLGLTPQQTASLPPQLARDSWPVLRKLFTAVFLTKTRQQWTAIYEDTDACVTPVLELNELHKHKHHQARQFLQEETVPQPAPRLGRTPARPNWKQQAVVGADTKSVLSVLYNGYELDELVKRGVISKL